MESDPDHLPDSPPRPALSTASSSSSAPPEAQTTVATLADIQTLIDQAEARHRGPPSFDPAEAPSEPRRFLLVPFTEAEIQTDPDLPNIIRGATEDTGLRKLALKLYETDPGPSPHWSADDLVRRFNACTSEKQASLVAEAADKIPIRLPYPPQDSPYPPPRPNDTVFVLAHGNTKSAEISCGGSRIGPDTLLNRMRGGNLVPDDVGRIKLISCGGDHTLHPAFIAQCQTNDVYGQSMVTAYGSKDQDSLLWHNNSPLSHLDKGMRSVENTVLTKPLKSDVQDRLDDNPIRAKAFHESSGKSQEEVIALFDENWKKVEDLGRILEALPPPNDTDTPEERQAKIDVQRGIERDMHQANVEMGVYGAVHSMSDKAKEQYFDDLWDAPELLKKQMDRIGNAHSQKVQPAHKTKASPGGPVLTPADFLTGGSSSSSSPPPAAPEPVRASSIGSHPQTVASPPDSLSTASSSSSAAPSLTEPKEEKRRSVKDDFDVKKEPSTHHPSAPAVKMQEDPLPDSLATEKPEKKPDPSKTSLRQTHPDLDPSQKTGQDTPDTGNKHTFG